MDNYLYPLPRKILLKRFESLFWCIAHRSSVSFVGLPESAKSGYLQFILSKPDHLEELLQDHIKNTILVYFSPISFEPNNPYAWLHQLNIKLAEIDSTYHCIQSNDPVIVLSSIQHYLIQLHDRGKHCVFIINNQEYWTSLPSVAGQIWKAIFDTKRHPPNPACSLVFLLHTSPYILQDSSDFFRELYIPLQENVLFFPTLSQEESLYTIQRFSSFSHNELSIQIKNMLVQYSGGYYPVLRESVRLFFRVKRKITQKHLLQLGKHDVLLSLFQKMWDSFTESEKSVLRRIVQYKSVPKDTEQQQFLSRLGVIANTGKLQSLWFEIFIREKMYRSALSPFEVDRFSYLSGIEQTLIHEFLKRKNEVISREEIAQILWGEKYLEKYSDWAIDKTISRMRKNMEHHHSTISVQTIKGKGYQII
ncbi:MAG: winged helix-turn-helix transcriptional regulator [Candidatus Pacebacteria bacterium]|nr:winged helix-turn-helix transcriptional regulator [Candidatus Paceibacterota bacterium]